MGTGGFRFAYLTPHYDQTVSFYRDILEFPVSETWNRNADDRGTLFEAGGGFIEVLARPENGEADFVFDQRPPQGAFMVVQVRNARNSFLRAQEKGAPIREGLVDRPWGHRSFCVSEPNGLIVYFYEEIVA